MDAGDLTWEPGVMRALERMSIFQRERLRERLAAAAVEAGRRRVTAEDLAAARAGGMRARRADEAAAERPLEPVAWPVLAGAYRLLDPQAPVAVCTLASEDLVRELGEPAGVALVGRAFTENLGAEKVAINVVSNPAIRVLLLCGTESRHRVGQTLEALHANGLDEAGRVVGSEGPLPLVRNFPPEAQRIFSEEVTIVNLVDVTDPGTILQAVARARDGGGAPRRRAWRPAIMEQTVASTPPRAARAEDVAGFLLLSLGARRDRIVLEHYSNDAELMHVISSRSAEALGREAARVGAVLDLTHAAYLGREALKAELALRHGLAYEQDRPLTVGRAPAG